MLEIQLTCQNQLNTLWFAVKCDTWKATWKIGTIARRTCNICTLEYMLRALLRG